VTAPAAGGGAGAGATPHTVWSEDEAKAAIRKFDVLIDMANTAGVTENDLDAAKEALKQAVKNFASGDLNETFNSISLTKEKLNDGVSALGGVSDDSHWKKWFGMQPRWRPYLKFVFPMYGFWPILTALIFFALYASLLWWWPILHQSILHLRNLGYGIPMWVALVAGIGACVQIMVDVTNDVKTNGYVEEYRRMWYMLLPIVGPVFGVIAYVLLFQGFLSLSGITAQQLGKQTLSVVLVCFLAGYSTQWFMTLLSNLTTQTPAK